MQAQQLVSVVTVVYNGEHCIERAIRSVLDQTYEEVEHLIVDAGSSDRTLEILREFDDRIDYWVSEPDEGIYDAMNKGLDAARGEWICFLGADDVFFGPDTLESVFSSRDIPDHLDLLFGDIRYTDGRRFRSRFGPALYFRNSVHHQGAFYRRRVFEGFRYDRRFSVVGDYELNLLMYLHKRKAHYLGSPIAVCGLSTSTRGRLEGYLEEMSIRHRHVGPFVSLPFDAFALLRCLRKRWSKTAKWTSRPSGSG